MEEKGVVVRFHSIVTYIRGIRVFVEADPSERTVADDVVCTHRTLCSSIWVQTFCALLASSACLVSTFSPRVLFLGSSIRRLLFSFSVLGGAGVAYEKQQLRYIPKTSLLDPSAHC